MQWNDSVGNVQLMQKINRLKVLNYVRKHKQATRSQIIKATSLCASSVTNIVRYLTDEGYVISAGTVSNDKIGRRAQMLEYRPDCLRMLFIHIDYDVVTLGLANSEGVIDTHERVAFQPGSKWSTIWPMLMEKCHRLTDDGKYPPDAVAVAVSAIVQQEGNLIVSATHKWLIRDVKEELSKHLHAPVYIVNNTTTKAIRCIERQQAAQYPNVLFLDLAEGVGLVHLQNGQVNAHVMGEIGHTCIDRQGPECFCGNRGCLELYFSKEKILADVSRAIGFRLTFDQVLDYEEDGNADVKRILQTAGRYMGVLLTNSINLFNPDHIFVNDGGMLACKTLFDTAVQVAKDSVHECFWDALDLKTVKVDTFDAVAGLCIYVADQIFSVA